MTTHLWELETNLRAHLYKLGFMGPSLTDSGSGDVHKLKKIYANISEIRHLVKHEFFVPEHAESFRHQNDLPAALLFQ